ncbi:MAG TPA: metallophosphoesterase [Candidatus Marinimicrobia bacterium]|nr:metallophosphoesterase [Candidatus Neomarinimicrobiota bacterium]
MRILQFIIFFSIALVIYFVFNYTIYIYGLKAFSISPLSRLIYIIAFIAFASSYFLGRILERISIGSISNFLTQTGSFWLAAMVYFLLIVFLINLLQIINHFIPFFPAILRSPPLQIKFYTGIISIVVVSIVLIAGRINALNPHIRQLNIQINKKVVGSPKVTIALISDIHLGALVGPKQLRKMITLINEINPDLVLFAGDVVDEDLGLVIYKDLGKCLQEIEAPLGVYSVTGNHEYIGGIDAAIHYLQDHGITVLRDSVTQLANGIILIGREDRDCKQFNGFKRQPLKELVKDINPSALLILLDHQPIRLSEAVVNGIDLQLSGHTHHGQLWPFNIITSWIYRISFGYLRIENTHFYVSCGFGTWGPPIRTSSRPEIVKIVLRTRSH